MAEISFLKYLQRGPDYHWRQISWSPLHRNTYVTARYQYVLAALQNHLADATTLDMGCGSGTLAHLLARHGARVTGIDTSPEAIAYAQQRLQTTRNCTFAVAPVYKTPFADRSFDNIVATEIIEHLEEPDKLLIEMKRVWNGRGKVIITTPIKLTSTPLDTMHVQEYFPLELNALLTKHFTSVEIHESHPVFWLEFRRKRALGIAAGQYLLNAADICFGINPFTQTKGWQIFAQQTAVIS